jgi:hypothetical protein
VSYFAIHVSYFVDSGGAAGRHVALDTRTYTQGSIKALVRLYKGSIKALFVPDTHAHIHTRQASGMSRGMRKRG